MVKEFDHPGFFVRDRQGLVLLVTALRRALPTELYIDLLYRHWQNVEGQVRSRITFEQNNQILLNLVLMVSSSYSLS